jgi:predicted nucleic-acid-binding protein
MRGLDTNVLLRYATADDPEQTVQAAALIEEAERTGGRLHVNAVVLCEFVWTLRGGAYRFDAPAIAGAIEALLAAPVFSIQDRDAVRLALDDYRRGPADFADYLIARLNLKAGCVDTASFDRRLDGSAGVTQLGAAS